MKPMKGYSLYDTKEVIDALGELKNEVDSMRGMLKRIAKLRKAGNYVHYYFHHWILRDAKDLLNKAQILFDLIEKEDNETSRKTNSGV